MKQEGKYYILPAEGKVVSKLTFDGRIRIHFGEAVESYLDLHGPFRLTQHKAEKLYDPTSIDAWNAILLLFGKQLEKAKADKHGNLWLTFADQTAIHVEDGPYENWHYTEKRMGGNNLFVHGGIGQTSF